MKPAVERLSNPATIEPFQISQIKPQVRKNIWNIEVSVIVFINGI
jgi:hypothetical protein